MRVGMNAYRSAFDQAVTTGRQVTTKPVSTPKPSAPSGVVVTLSSAASVSKARAPLSNANVSYTPASVKANSLAWKLATDGVAMRSKTFPLNHGWRARVDGPSPANPKGQAHVHVYDPNNREVGVWNTDGSRSHKGTGNGKVPNGTKKEIQEKCER